MVNSIRMGSLPFSKKTQFTEKDKDEFDMITTPRWMQMESIFSSKIFRLEILDYLFKSSV